MVDRVSVGSAVLAPPAVAHHDRASGHRDATAVRHRHERTQAYDRRNRDGQLLGVDDEPAVCDQFGLLGELSDLMALGDIA